METIKEIQKQIEMESQNKEDKYKVGDNEYKFNITGNITKDLILDEIKRSGKENFDKDEVLRKLDEYIGDKASESVHFKFYKIPENDRLKNYQLLVKYIKFRMNESNNNEDLWKTFINPIIENARVFEIEDELISILSDTDSTKTEMPFGQIALDCRVPIGDRIYHGIIISNITHAEEGEENGMFESTEKDKDKQYLGIFSCYTKIDKKDGERKMYLEVFFIDRPDEEKPDKYQKKLMSFIYSFSNFLNEPEVEIIDNHFNEKNNIRRAERDRMPLPQNSRITIYGKLKKYVANYNEGLRSGYNHKFRVRGHFKHFRDTKRYFKIYKLDAQELSDKGYQESKGIIKKWVKPYLKGEGILIEKTYKLVKRKSE